MVFTLAFLGLMALSRGLPQDDCSAQSMFSVFSDGEFPVTCPTVLPPGARRVLASVPYLRGTMRYEGVRDLPADWFSATYVHLGPAGERDLLAIGKGPLLGANVGPIWVLRPMRTGWTIIVDGAPVLGVKISEHRTNGYCDLVISNVTAGQVYTGILRFDGRVYQLAKGFWAPISK
jgi:hypothetical protein